MHWYETQTVTDKKMQSYMCVHMYTYVSVMRWTCSQGLSERKQRTPKGVIGKRSQLTVDGLSSRLSMHWEPLGPFWTAAHRWKPSKAIKAPEEGWRGFTGISTPNTPGGCYIHYGWAGGHTDLQTYMAQHIHRAQKKLASFLPPTFTT